ncbi:hypothetical protein IW261DRAFT_1596413 [Armillaria novae-zelandiae]|uniref:F-box domain-containing protein n=1 Tax=Armillaria novae-zelandiae TaxID=153914 RepID=A0AA39NX29_9AGAR|nr:hypothetical protein IW261DRAFT_1596413 [Armillaria novae-zelandiae]
MDVHEEVSDGEETWGPMLGQVLIFRESKYQSHIDSREILEGLILVTGEMPTLCNLPNELLCLIFEDLDLSSLIAVSCVCQRINSVALAQFISPHTNFYGIRLAAPSLLFGGSSRLAFNSIAALRLSFSMKCPLGFLSFHFSLEGCLEEMEQVTRLFKTQRALQSLSLHFPGMPTLFDAPAALYSPMDCCAAVCSLLCHLRPVRCHALNINNTPQVEYPEGAKFHGPIVNTLKDIALSRAHFMFTDFFRDWTLNTMMLSPLTQVSLVDMDIRAVLPSLSLPSLEKLTIRCPDPSSKSRYALSIAPSHHRQSYAQGNYRTTAFLAPASLPELTDISSTRVTCYGSVILSPVTSPHPSAVQMLFQNIALHDSIDTLDLPLVDLNVSDEWLSVAPRYEHLLTGITDLYINPSMTVKIEGRDEAADYRVDRAISKPGESEVVWDGRSVRSLPGV